VLKRVRSVRGPNADEIRVIISAVDKAAKRGIIHRNTANRRKARLNKALSAAK
jgi:ribosomal protein S20